MASSNTLPNTSRREGKTSTSDIFMASRIAAGGRKPVMAQPDGRLFRRKADSSFGAVGSVAADQQEHLPSGQGIGQVRQIAPALFLADAPDIADDAPALGNAMPEPERAGCLRIRDGLELFDGHSVGNDRDPFAGHAHGGPGKMRSAVGQRDDFVGVPQRSSLDQNVTSKARAFEPQRPLQPAPERCVERNHDGHPRPAEKQDQDPAPDRMVEVDMDKIVTTNASGQEPQYAEQPGKAQQRTCQSPRNPRPDREHFGSLEQTLRARAARNMGHGNRLRETGPIDSLGQRVCLDLQPANRIERDRPRPLAVEMWRQAQDSGSRRVVISYSSTSLRLILPVPVEG